MKKKAAYESFLVESPSTPYAWQLNTVGVFLFNQTTGLSLDLLSNVKIYSRSPIRYLPWYKARKGGGAITLGNSSWQSITFTENFFSTDKNLFGSAAYANNLRAWLNLLSHEVGHLDHAFRFKSLFVYLIVFAYQYALHGHDKAPLEIEADLGKNKFKSFRHFVNKQFGNGALDNLLLSDQTQHAKLQNLQTWLAAFNATET